MSLSAADISTLSRLLDQVMDLPAREREPWLAALPVEQASFVPHLRQMLAAQARTGALLDTRLPAVDLGGAVDDTLAAGDWVGPYRVLRAIGQGGMGSVWLAERADGVLKRQVALKLPRISWGGGLARRMAREREIGARLEHPNIARLYDAGVDARRGWPYLAFEYVDGQAIDQWCREQLLSTRDRVKLLVQVARAVAYAHGRLVVHRDIKPSNVMVSAGGQVHLLDFGIATLVQAASADTDAGSDVLARTRTFAPTRTQDRALTLHCASPEQLRGEHITVASDVYSLGVLGYELLTGCKPFQPKRATAAAMEEAILQGDPPRASSRVQRPQAQAIKGDLDAILAKALMLVAQDRYPSADAFADDLQRHLDYAPVLARPASVAYRLAKFTRRHRMGMAATAGLCAIAVLAGGQVLSHRRQADISVAQSETANALLQHVFSGMSPDVAETQRFSAAELLGRADQFLLQNPSPSADVRRQARWRMAELFEEVGAFDRAAAIYRDAEQEARAAGDDARLAEALIQLADLELKAERSNQSRAALARLPQSLSNAPILQAHAAILEGDNRLFSGDLLTGIAALEQGQRLLRAAGSNDALWWARSTRRLGHALRRDGQLQRAQEQLLLSVEWHQRLSPRREVYRLAVEGDLAALDSWRGNFAAAEARLRVVHGDLQRRMGALHPGTLAAATELAYTHLRQGHFDAARREADALIAEIGTQADKQWASEFMELTLARIDMYEGRYERALPSLRERLARIAKEAGSPGAMAEPVRRIYGEALLRSGDLAESERVLRQTQNHQLVLSGDAHPSVATTRILLGVVAARHGDRATARAHWARSHAILSQHYGDTHPFALAAQAYATLEAPKTTPAERSAIAVKLNAASGWQRECGELVRMLRAGAPPVDWRNLPVVL